MGDWDWSDGCDDDGDDSDFDWESEMDSAIARDDQESFISLDTSPVSRNFGASYVVPKLWNLICGADAVNCATALLEGKLDQTAHVDRPGCRGAYPLHFAAYELAPRVIELLLSRGAQPNIRLYDERDMDKHDVWLPPRVECRLEMKEQKGMLPLNIALDSARQTLCWHNVYSPGQPTFQLIVSLCLPLMKRALAACKLLACSSENVEKEAYCYGMEGKLVELAVLLIVARKQVFTPVTFHRNDGAVISTRMTILQCLKNQILSLVDEEMKPMNKFEHGRVIQIQSKIMALRSTALLLKVFESAGDSIEEYLQLQQPVDVQREQMEKDVALRLAEKGFILKDGDFDFSIGDCDSLLFAWNNQEVPRDGHQWSALSLPTPHLLKNMMKSIRTDQVLKSISGSRYSTGVDIQVKKQTKPISREILAKFALSIKNGIRTP
ncbi:hypothetical protein RHGRI_037838 [Rhododendron griersonianum]|uniref:Ankyrin repeat family protein n=1 Tax=Rhododendron griersonianum TaxID=479676 RepID=A0AAV6HZ21_9ERIC|nr:hypothetical protein RHGRI_037838 [Rhododendron griersonianum]